MTIFASGGLDEDDLMDFARRTRPSTAMAWARALSPRPTRLRLIAPTSLRNTVASRAASAQPARHLGPAASRCGAVTGRTAA